MSDEINTLSKISKKINMPRIIRIGDPYYFELNTEKQRRLVYDKEFVNYKNWKGEVTIEEIQSKFDDFDDYFNNLRLNIYLAPNEQLLETYAQGFMLSSQEAKSTEIGVDSASYLINIDGREITFNTMSDGFFGEVIEFYNNDILTGITIVLYTAEDYELDRFKSEISYLFDIDIS